MHAPLTLGDFGRGFSGTFSDFLSDPAERLRDRLPPHAQHARDVAHGESKAEVEPGDEALALCEDVLVITRGSEMSWHTEGLRGHTYLLLADAVEVLLGAVVDSAAVEDRRAHGALGVELVSVEAVVPPVEVPLDE